jgi:RNA recognition motif-containing protein
MPTIVPATTNSTKKSHHQDKNNNNEEENYENQYQLLRKDDKIDQTILSVKLKVKMLANKGNELAKQNEFFKAIEKFSEAIRYDSSDHRLFGNRSYCYDKVNQFQEGLRDAERAISLEPGWQKGYFRKGRALFGLKMYKEAEKAYEQVLEFENMDDPELEEELFKVRVLQLQEMGFSKLQSEIAIRNNGNVQVALESIFMYSKSEKSNESCSDIDNNELDYIENDSENGDNNSNNNEYNNKKSKVTNKNGVDLKSNAHGENGVVSTSLWIGNVDPNVSEETLNEMFAAFGPLSNVRCLPEKYCAFVNFKLKEDAQKAMLDLQGKNLEGQRLLIKYPDNPNTALLSSLVLKSQTKGDKASNNIEVNNSTKLKKQKPDTQTTSDSKIVTTTTLITTSNNKNATTIKQSNSNFYSNNNNYDDDNNGSKLTGPVNGNECYFWRTTGCLYAEKCRYDHIKKSKGCDKKPWHK